MEELQCEKPALALADHGFKVFPLSPNSKVPLKGTHGYQSASSDLETVFNWIVAEPRMNLGLCLDSMLVVDVDMHDSEHNGRESLLKLAKKGYQLPTNTYIEQTPNNGLHYFYKYNGKPTRKVNIIDGIDLLTDFAVIAPSEINGKQYKPIGDTKIADSAPAPQWLVDMMKPRETKSDFSFEVKFPNRKKYMGKLLDEIVKGTEVGNRNEWLTQLAGKLIWTGADAPTVYNMLCFANDNLTQPISDKELNVIFRSIVNKEKRVVS